MQNHCFQKYILDFWKISSEMNKSIELINNFGEIQENLDNKPKLIIKLEKNENEIHTDVNQFNRRVDLILHNKIIDYINQNNLGFFPNSLPFSNKVLNILTQNINQFKTNFQINEWETIISVKFTFSHQDKTPKILPLALLKEGKIGVFLLDPGILVDNLLNERLIPQERPSFTKIPFNYHFIPKKILTKLSKYKIQKIYSNLNSHLLKWPMDYSAEIIRWLFIFTLKLLLGNQKIPYISFWPNQKKGAIVITHDIDSKQGATNYKQIYMMEQKLNIPATIFICSKILRQSELKQQYLLINENKDYEVGDHGFDHTGKIPYQSKKKNKITFETIKKDFNPITPLGFRSPVLLRTPELFEMIEEQTFSYDSSIPNSDLNITGVLGSGTTFPFFKEKLIEIPLTLPMDYVFINLNFNPEKVLEIYEQIIKEIMSIHGLVVLNFHPESHLSYQKSWLNIMNSLFLKIKTHRNQYFLTTMQNIALSWQIRQKLKVEKVDGTWQIISPKDGTIPKIPEGYEFHIETI